MIMVECGDKKQYRFQCTKTANKEFSLTLLYNTVIHAFYASNLNYSFLSKCNYGVQHHLGLRYLNQLSVNLSFLMFSDKYLHILMPNILSFSYMFIIVLKLLLFIRIHFYKTNNIYQLCKTWF